MSGNALANSKIETDGSVQSLQREEPAKDQFVGYIDEATRFFVTGWVADKADWSRSLRVDILVNDVPIGYCDANLLREGLKSLDPNSTGRYAFRYYYANPLSMFEANRVTVRVSKTKSYLVETREPIPAPPRDQSLSSQRPSGPILLTTCGRTGSTVIMSEMARHPHIVVAGKRPFEIELGCYYAYALRTLSAATDTERSLRPDRITATENRFHIGFNPYFDHALAPTIFKDPGRLTQFVYDRVPGHLANAFREIILEFYQEVAADQGISHPIYFAEKSLPERDSRLGVRYMFPNVREIVLVRDFRDIVCSSMATKNADFEQIFKDVLAAARMFRKILDGGSDDVLLLKYEDYVAHKEETLVRVFGYLGLGVPSAREGALKSLFDVHATSASPEASIGRWRRDLTPEQIERCAVFEADLDRLGYNV